MICLHYMSNKSVARIIHRHQSILFPQTLSRVEAKALFSDFLVRFLDTPSSCCPPCAKSVPGPFHAPDANLPPGSRPMPPLFQPYKHEYMAHHPYQTMSILGIFREQTVISSPGARKPDPWSIQGSRFSAPDSGGLPLRVSSRPVPAGTGEGRSHPAPRAPASCFPSGCG